MLYVTLWPIWSMAYKYLQTTVGKKKQMVFWTKIPVDIWRNYVQVTTMPQKDFLIQSGIQISSVELAPAMGSLWLSKPTESSQTHWETSSSWETIPHQKRPSFHRAANPPTHSSLWFSLKNQQRNRMQACRLLWIAPIKRKDVKMERSFWSPKWRNVKHIPKEIRVLLGVAHSFPSMCQRTRADQSHLGLPRH